MASSGPETLGEVPKGGGFTSMHPQMQFTRKQPKGDRKQKRDPSRDRGGEQKQPSKSWGVETARTF